MAVAIRRLNRSTMKEQEEIAYINNHKMKAARFNKDAVVVSAARARAAVERAYQKGVIAGVDSTMAVMSDEKAINPIYLNFKKEDYE